MGTVKKLASRHQFVAEIDGRTVVVLAGARFPVASEIVKQHPDFFEVPAEQPTAAPGVRDVELRARRRGDRGLARGRWPGPSGSSTRPPPHNSGTA